MIFEVHQLSHHCGRNFLDIDHQVNYVKHSTIVTAIYVECIQTIIFKSCKFLLLGTSLDKYNYCLVTEKLYLIYTYISTCVCVNYY